MAHFIHEIFLFGSCAYIQTLTNQAAFLLLLLFCGVYEDNQQFQESFRAIVDKIGLDQLKSAVIDLVMPRWKN